MFNPRQQEQRRRDQLTPAERAEEDERNKQRNRQMKKQMKKRMMMMSIWAVDKSDKPVRQSPPVPRPRFEKAEEFKPVLDLHKHPLPPFPPQASISKSRRGVKPDTLVPKFQYVVEAVALKSGFSVVAVQVVGTDSKTLVAWYSLHPDGSHAFITYGSQNGVPVPVTRMGNTDYNFIAVSTHLGICIFVMVKLNKVKSKVKSTTSSMAPPRKIAKVEGIERGVDKGVEEGVMILSPELSHVWIPVVTIRCPRLQQDSVYAVSTRHIAVSTEGRLYIGMLNLENDDLISLTKLETEIKQVEDALEVAKEIWKKKMEERQKQMEEQRLHQQKEIHSELHQQKKKSKKRPNYEMDEEDEVQTMLLDQRDKLNNQARQIRARLLSVPHAAMSQMDLTVFLSDDNLTFSDDRPLLADNSYGFSTEGTSRIREGITNLFFEPVIPLALGGGTETTPHQLYVVARNSNHSPPDRILKLDLSELDLTDKTKTKFTSTVVMQMPDFETIRKYRNDIPAGNYNIDDACILWSGGMKNIGQGPVSLVAKVTHYNQLTNACKHYLVAQDILVRQGRGLVEVPQRMVIHLDKMTNVHTPGARVRMAMVDDTIVMKTAEEFYTATLCRSWCRNEVSVMWSSMQLGGMRIVCEDWIGHESIPKASLTREVCHVYPIRDWSNQWVIGMDDGYYDDKKEETVPGTLVYLNQWGHLYRARDLDKNEFKWMFGCG